MQESHYNHLILKFLSNDISHEEHQELFSWVDKSPENRKAIEEIRKVWNLSNKNLTKPDFQTPEEWRKLELALEQTAHKETRERKFDFSRSGFFKIAASIAILLVCSVVLYFFNFQNQVIVKESGSEKAYFTFPDGSEIWLNEKSKISYTENFNKEERFVKLSGEAFFDVKKNPNKPFIIIANDAQIKVLGTSFNVRAYNEEQTTEVVVVTGTVSLSVLKKEILLHPNEKGILLKKNNALSLKVVENPNAVAWKSNQLVFKKSRLSEVVETLEDYFKIKIAIKNPDLLACRFTSTFNDPTIGEVLEALQYSLNLDIVGEGKSYTLDGEGC